MTQTTQLRSWATLSEAGKNLTLKKSETDDNRSRVLLVFDALNDLSEKLSRLEYLIKRKNLEQILYQKGRE